MFTIMFMPFQTGHAALSSRISPRLSPYADTHGRQYRSIVCACKCMVHVTLVASRRSQVQVGHGASWWL